jgi:hypothetical protein
MWNQFGGIVSSYIQAPLRFHLNAHSGDIMRRIVVTGLFLVLLLVPSCHAIQASAAASQYSVWQDPAESAFTVSLPADWKISGGTFRSTPIEVHYLVRAHSPDGGARVFMDNTGIKLRAVPNQATQALGLSVGQMMPTGSGTSLLVEPYRPGAQFATEYVQQTYCPSATEIQGGLIESQTQALNAQFAPIAQAEGKTAHIDAGEVSFKCGQRVGYVYAITILTSQPGATVSIWAVYRIAGYLAEPADAASAADVVNHALGTFQMNQAWLQNYAKQTGDTAGNVIRESNVITQSTIQREQAMNTRILETIQAVQPNADTTLKTMASSTPPANNNDKGRRDSAQQQTKTVCDSLGRCQTVDAEISNWWSDCSGEFHPGPPSGGPPKSTDSACWSEGADKRAR